jgi:flagellar hook assembly protein FlgD
MSGTFASVQGAGGTVSYTGTGAVLTFTGVDVPAPGEPPTLALALEPILPNPISGDATIVFALPSAGSVTLTIHDASGRLVRVLAEGEFAAGRHPMRWDGRTQVGSPARPGIYLVRMTALGKHLSRKLIVR